MSSTPQAIPSGLQKLLDSGLLTNGLSKDKLTSASAPQLQKIATSNAALQQTDGLLGQSGSDSVYLSTDPTNSIAQFFNTDDGSGSQGTDYLSQAVSNQLTHNIDSAVNQFLPAQTPELGTHINHLG